MYVPITLGSKYQNLQTCSTHSNIRAQIRPKWEKLKEKLWGSHSSLKKMVDFVRVTGLQTSFAQMLKKKKIWIELCWPELSTTFLTTWRAEHELLKLKKKCITLWYTSDMLCINYFILFLKKILLLLCAQWAYPQRQLCPIRNAVNTLNIPHHCLSQNVKDSAGMMIIVGIPAIWLILEYF